MAEERSERFAVRMTPDERRMLAELADESGLDAADIVRTLIREEYARKHPQKKRKT
jgi:hypothetical protein